jgi:hypothetical protein
MFLEGKTEKRHCHAGGMLPDCDLDLPAGRDLDSRGLIFAFHLINQSSPFLISCFTCAASELCLDILI